MPLDHWSDPGFLSAGLWLTSMTNVSTFPFLMRSAKRGEGNKLLERLWQFTRRSYRLHLTWLFFCSTRTYTVPDPPDLFDGHVWPMYLKHRKEMDNNCSRIGATNHKSLQTLHATTLLCLSNHIPDVKDLTLVVFFLDRVPWRDDIEGRYLQQGVRKRTELPAEQLIGKVWNIFTDRSPMIV